MAQRTFVKRLSLDRDTVARDHEINAARHSKVARDAGHAWAQHLVPVVCVHHDSIELAHSDASLSDLFLMVADGDEDDAVVLTIALSLAASTLHALERLQTSAHFVHNDLRTDNVLIAPDGHVWIADLELATWMDDDGASVARVDLAHLRARRHVWGDMYGRPEQDATDALRAHRNSADAQVLTLDVIAHMVLIAHHAPSARARRWLARAIPTWCQLSGHDAPDTTQIDATCTIRTLQDAYTWLKNLLPDNALTHIFRPLRRLDARERRPLDWTRVLEE